MRVAVAGKVFQGHGQGAESLDLGALASGLSVGTWPWCPITLAG